VSSLGPWKDPGDNGGLAPSTCKLAQNIAGYYARAGDNENCGTTANHFRTVAFLVRVYRGIKGIHKFHVENLTNRI